jgi:choline transport protein
MPESKSGIGFLINAFAVRTLPFINSFALFWSLLGALISIITVVACSKGNYQPARFVFTTTINTSGWGLGPAWILGLLQSSFALTAFDSVMHLVEEMSEPEWNAPM